MIFNRRYLLYLMVTQNVSVRELADAAGTGRKSVYYWLNGTYQPTKDNVKRIAKRFHVREKDFYREHADVELPKGRLYLDLNKLVVLTYRKGLNLKALIAQIPTYRDWIMNVATTGTPYAPGVLKRFERISEVLDVSLDEICSSEPSPRTHTIGRGKIRLKHWNAEYLQKLIAETDIPLAQIAESMKVSVMSLYRWVNGKGAPSPNSIKRLAVYFKAPKENFFISDTAK